MKIRVNGANLTLTKNQFVAAGGEGSVYARGSTGYKLYHDPKHAVPAAKIAELGKIQDPHVIIPKDVVYDHKGVHVGHSFTFVPNCRVLCELFPRAFRDREGITPDIIGKLVTQFRGSVQSVHDANCLVVDNNEMNALVAPDFQDVWLIDTDSYQTPSYPATAIMPSVRDWRTPIKDLNVGSDWFSFGVVAFQMFRGIHPYKGKHSVKGLENRMKAGISVFDPSVRVPKAAYPETVIPAAWLEWFRATFVDHKRVAPPVDMQGTLPAVYMAPVLVQGKLKTTVLFDLGKAVRGVWHTEGETTVVDAGGLLRRGKLSAQVNGSPVGVTHTQKGDPVFLSYDNGVLSGYNLVTRTHSNTMPGEVVVESNGAVYVKAGNRVSRVVARTAGSTTALGSQEVARVLPHATRLFSGCILQNVLGAPLVSLLEGTSVHQVTLDEIKGYQVHAAKYDSGVLVVVGSKQGSNQGRYDRIVLRFSPDRRTWDTRVVEDVPFSGVNFTVLDKGVVILMNEEGALELFSSKKGSSQFQLLEDDSVDPVMVLTSAGNTLLATHGDKVLRLSLS